MKDIEKNSDYLDGKKQGELDRAIDELSDKEIKQGDLLLQIATSKGGIYTNRLHIQGWQAWYQGERDRYTLGYLVGYRRARINFDASSLTYAEVKDIPPFLLATNSED